MDTTTYGFKLLIEPASDLPGTWVTHILDIDVVTYGATFRQALDLGIEAAALVVSDDLEHGLDPLARDRAPIEIYRRVARIIESRQPLMPLDQLEARIATGERIAAVFFVSVQVGHPQREQPQLIGQPAPLDQLAA